ncbi:MAG TPA: hypothetical protein VFO46_06980 [Candidatus Sulfotelmatobacter sp.]|nr:hypothetical protein [Candidatus Sulfotelmatobacter sp.]
MAEAAFEYIVRALLLSFKTIVHWMKSAGASKWSCAEGTVTAQPTISRLPGLTVEVVYSYRFKGELYTGFHEEPFFLADSVTEYIDRFSSERKFVVRVKPNEPEISLVREEDQAIDLALLKAEESS